MKLLFRPLTLIFSFGLCAAVCFYGLFAGTDMALFNKFYKPASIEESFRVYEADESLLTSHFYNEISSSRCFTKNVPKFNIPKVIYSNLNLNIACPIIECQVFTEETSAPLSLTNTEDEKNFIRKQLLFPQFIGQNKIVKVSYIDVKNLENTITDARCNFYGLEYEFNKNNCVPLFYAWEDGILPSTSFSMIMESLEADIHSIVITSGKYVKFSNKQKTFTIPLNEDGTIFLPEILFANKTVEKIEDYNNINYDKPLIFTSLNSISPVIHAATADFIMQENYISLTPHFIKFESACLIFILVSILFYIKSKISLDVKKRKRRIWIFSIVSIIFLIIILILNCFIYNFLNTIPWFTESLILYTVPLLFCIFGRAL